MEPTSEQPISPVTLVTPAPKKQLPLIAAVLITAALIIGTGAYWFFRPLNIEQYNEVLFGKTAQNMQIEQQASTAEPVTASGRDQRTEVCKEKADQLPEGIYSLEGGGCVVAESYRGEVYEIRNKEVAEGDTAENWELLNAYEREGAVYIEVQDYRGPYGGDASGCSPGDEPFSRTGTRGHITWFDCIKNSTDETYWYNQREPFPVITVQLVKETKIRYLSGYYYLNYFTLTPEEYLNVLTDDTLPSPSFTVNLIMKNNKVLFLHESPTQ